MKYFVIFLVLIGFLSPSVAFAQYLGDVEFYHLPLTAESKQYSVLTQSNTNYFTDVAYDNKANSLIFSTSASEDFIDTYTITMNEQTFSELFATDYAKTPDSMLVLINGIEQPYQIFIDNDIISWRFYATTSSDEVELLPSTHRFDTGTYKFDKIPNGSPKIYPPLKQNHIGIVTENIQCKDELILIKKYDGSPACVMESTKQKLVERGWTNFTPIKPEVGKFGTYHLNQDGKIFDIKYHIQNGADIKEIIHRSDVQTIEIILDMVDESGSLEVKFPHRLFDSILNEDVHHLFFVLIDGQEIDYDETTNETTRTLVIPFEKDSEIIKIIGATKI